MSAKIDNSIVFQTVGIQSRETHFSLSPSEVCIRRNGVEFHSDSPITTWTEMTVTLHSTKDAGKVNCNGVVVGCHGNRHMGYTVSMVFTNLSRQSQARLDSLAFS